MPVADTYTPAASYYCRVGDTATPLGARLIQSGQPAVLGEVTQFRLVRDDGRVIRDWTADRVVVVDAAAAAVQYTFASPDTSRAGTYFASFRTGDGASWTTFPGDGNRLRVLVRA